MNKFEIAWQSYAQAVVRGDKNLDGSKLNVTDEKLAEITSDFENYAFDRRAKLNSERQQALHYEQDTPESDRLISQYEDRILTYAGRIQHMEKKYEGLVFCDMLYIPGVSLTYKEPEIHAPSPRGVSQERINQEVEAFGGLTDDNYDRVAAELELYADDGLRLDGYGMGM